MEFKEEYGKAAVEVLEILSNTNEEDVKRIPKNFIEFLKENVESNYAVNFDYSKKIDELKLSEKTKELLGVIYINWWCGENEKKEFRRKAINYELKRELKTRENHKKIYKG